MDFEIQEEREVYWASTNQYKMEFEDGTVMEFRAAEDSNGTDFYVLTDSGWDSLEEDNEYHDTFEEAWSEGLLA